MENTVNLCTIGIDVHLSSLVCCAMRQENGELKIEKKTFGTFKNQKREMAAWCASHHPDLVIMESTGIYWKSPYAFLEKVGIRAAVVNARQVKQMEGKKTDMGDAEWLAHVGLLGCFCRSYIPKEIYRELRLPERHLLRLTDTLASEKNRFHKILADAGFRLSLVFSDLWGLSAMHCINGLLAGKSVEEIFAELKTGRLKASPEDIRAALEGELSDLARFTLITIKKHIEFLSAQIAEVQRVIVEKVKELHPEALVYLQTLPGVSELSAVKILIELGGDDMSPFKNAEYLASWIGVCPGNNESAGKRKHGHIRKGNYYLRRVLCECGNAAVRTKETTFSSKYQSLAVRRGKKRALIAIVCKMVKMIYYVLKNRVGYRDPEIDYEVESANKNARRWIKIMCKLPGWKLNATNLVSGEYFQSVANT